MLFLPFNATRRRTAVNEDMRGFSQFVLLLFATIQVAHAGPPPRVDLPASDILEVLNPIVILEGSEATISGSVQPSTPWAETDWGHLQVALFDDRGELIKRVAVDYSPRPVPHRFHSSYDGDLIFPSPSTELLNPFALLRLVTMTDRFRT